MLIKTNKKEDAIKAAINTWLKDSTKYCNECNEDYNPVEFPCCDRPMILDNLQATQLIIRQNKVTQDSRANDLAQTQDKSMRWGISMPPRLYFMLEKYVKAHGDKGLFREKGDITWFMKKFPQFKIPKTV